MPSAGLPIENLLRKKSNKQNALDVKYLHEAAAVAMSYGMFTEWLESFVGAWNHEKNITQAATAGLIEWDLGRNE